MFGLSSLGSTLLVSAARKQKLARAEKDNKAGSGLGVQFKTVRSEDQTRFSAMIKRLIQPKEDANLATGIAPKQ
jgi:hypothetical protein